MERGQTEHTAVSQGVLAGRDLTGGLRRQPRLDLRVPVRVSGSWSDGLTTFVPLLARSVNLSEGGMRVLTPLLLEPGSHVMCSLRLDGEPVYLAGRVAWQRGGPHAELKTMGIEFTQTSEVDQAPLRRALSRFSASHPVALRFDGHEEPVRAQARTDGSQLRIAARLPFLTQGNEVEFQLGEPETSYRGRVSEVTVDDTGAAPEIAVWLTVDPEQCEALRDQVERLEGRPLPPPGGRAGSTSSRPSASTPELSAPSPATARRTLHLTRTQLLALCCASLVLGALLAATTTPRASGTVLQPIAEAAAPVLPAPRLPGATSTVRSVPAVSDATEPTVSITRDGRVVGIPITGDLRELRDFQLASPPGIGVDLPNARARLPDAKYRLHRDGLLWLRIRNAPLAGTPTRLRLFLRDPIEEYGLERIGGDDPRLELVLPAR